MQIKTLKMEFSVIGTLGDKIGEKMVKLPDFALAMLYMCATNVVSHFNCFFAF